MPWFVSYNFTIGNSYLSSNTSKLIAMVGLHIDASSQHVCHGGTDSDCTVN